MNYLNGGYAMIKHNASQKDLENAYKTNRPVLVYDENRRAHWAVIEETATESVDEETQEPITIYEYSYRLIDEASGGATLDDIVDSRGNKRFIEGNGTPATITGLLEAYCKWSLSGTHLMIVFAGTLAKNTTIENYITVEFAKYELPEWVMNKIKTFIFPATGYSAAEVVDLIDFNLGTQSTTKKDMYLLKKESYLYIGFKEQYSGGTNPHTFRVQFDLLIDADYSE